MVTHGSHNDDLSRPTISEHLKISHAKTHVTMSEPVPKHISIANQTARSLLFLPVTLPFLVVAEFLPLKTLESMTNEVVPVGSLLTALVMYTCYRMLFGSYAPQAAAETRINVHGLKLFFCGVAAISVCLFAVFLPFSLYMGGTHFSPTVEVCMNTFLHAFAIAVMEEVVIRGVILHWLRRIAPAWLSIVGVSLVFMLWHVNGARDATALFNVFVGGGIAFTIALLLSKSIWMPIGLHAGYDFWVMLSDGTSVLADGYIHFQSRASVIVNGLLSASLLLLIGLVAWHFYLRRTPFRSTPMEVSGTN